MIARRSKSRSFTPQLEALLQAEPGTIEQRRHDPRNASQLVQHVSNLGRAEHDRHLRRHPRPWKQLDHANVQTQYVAIEKQDAAQRLVLCRCRDVLFNGQPYQKRRDLRCAKPSGMTPAMEHDEAPDPMDVGVLSPPAVVPRADLGAYLLHQTRRRHGDPRCDDDAIVVNRESI